MMASIPRTEREEQARFNQRMAAKGALQAIEADRIIAVLRRLIPIAEWAALDPTYNDDGDNFLEGVLTLPPLIEGARDYLLLSQRMDDSRRKAVGEQVLASLANGIARLVGLSDRVIWNDKDLVDLVSKLFESSSVS
jgi:hypothetical protein